MKANLSSVFQNFISRGLIAAAFIVGAAAVAPSLPVYASTADNTDPNQVECKDAENNVNISVRGGIKCAKSTDQKGNLGNVIVQVTNVLLFLIGAISVIMIIIGGIKYVLSNGDSNAVKSAKDTILYAVIGLVVALLAYAIVNFVLDSFMAGNGSDASQTKTD